MKKLAFVSLVLFLLTMPVFGASGAFEKTEAGQITLGLFVGLGLLLLAMPLLGVLGVFEKTKAGQIALEVVNPRGEIAPPPPLSPTPRIIDLTGKKIGIYWNGKAGGNNFWDAVEELLKVRTPSARILRQEGPFDPKDTLAATLAKEVDTFIYGVGD